MSSLPGLRNIFRTADDDTMITSEGSSTKIGIYQNIGDLPKYDFQTEIRRYNAARWDKGLLQTAIPIAVYGSIVGMFLGMYRGHYQSRYSGHHKVILRTTASGALFGFCAAGMHQFLVMHSDYRLSSWHPFLAGGIGGLMTSQMAGMNFTASGLTAFFTCIGYGGLSRAFDVYQRRYLKNFLQEQQRKQTPIHQVTPEMQPMYRAFLYDYRPIENRSELKRRAQLLSREDDGKRMDAHTLLQNIIPDFFDWITFPDWWPFRIAFHSEDEYLFAERLKEQELERFRQQFEDSADIFSYVNRQERERKVDQEES